MNDNNQINDDFGAFTAPDPAEVEAMKKEQAKKEAAKAKAAPKIPMPKKGTEKSAPVLSPEQEAAEKARLLGLINGYQNHIAEFFPDRLENVKIPKTLGAKNTIEELNVYVNALEAELGRNGAQTIVVNGWVGMFNLFEKVNEHKRFGLNCTGLGQYAQISVTPRMNPQTKQIMPGPATAVLNEFAIKYGARFSTAVEWRLLFMAFELVAGVHRMNEGADINVAKAAQKEASADLKGKLNEL